MNKFRRVKKITVGFICLWGLICLSACISHLKEAKYYYTEGEKFARSYQTEIAIAAFKRALRESELEIERHPSAQAYMLKGMAELNLKLWNEAEESFRSAFIFGFEKGEEWAEHLSLFGLARSLEEMGLENSAASIYFHLLNKAKIKPLSLLTMQRYADYSLSQALGKEGKERSKLLSTLLKTVEKLTAMDMSCGYYHYLQSQIFSHQFQYHQSFEKAVMARELGLPSQEILRDNDNQIVFCYQSLKKNLSNEEWERFHSLFLKWTKKWGWPGPETPAWKKR